MTKAKVHAANDAAAALAALSAGESEKFTQTHQRLVVQDYLPRTFHDGAAEANKCEWSSHVAVSLAPEEAGALAWVLIDTVMQVRFGPNRVGPAGLLQPIADAVKLLTKELISPTAASNRLFRLGPIMAIMPALAAWVVVPFGPEAVIAIVALIRRGA